MTSSHSLPPDAKARRAMLEEHQKSHHDGQGGGCQSSPPTPHAAEQDPMSAKAVFKDSDS